ncbi:MAG TPA: hypothetical protein PKJ79_08360 [Quisquiliibacterium sp.]|nr:hypothetical protein [Quisquiliibacterium sp.]
MTDRRDAGMAATRAATILTPFLAPSRNAFKIRATRGRVPTNDMPKRQESDIVAGSAEIQPGLRVLVQSRIGRDSEPTARQPNGRG